MSAGPVPVTGVLGNVGGWLVMSFAGAFQPHDRPTRSNRIISDLIKLFREQAAWTGCDPRPSWPTAGSTTARSLDRAINHPLNLNSRKDRPSCNGTSRT